MDRGAGSTGKIKGKSLIAVLDQALVSGATFLLTILMVRLLGLENFGLVALAQLCVIIIAAIVQALINAPFVSLAPGYNKHDQKRLVTQVLMINGLALIAGAVMGSLMAMLFLSGSAEIYTSSATAFTWPVFLGIWIIIHGLNECARRLMFYHDHHIKVFLCDLLRFTLTLILIIAGICSIKEHSLPFIHSTFESPCTKLESLLPRMIASDLIGWMILAHIVGLAFSFMAMFMLLTPHIHRAVKLDTIMVQKLFSQGKWLGPGSALQMISEQFFILFSGVFLGPAQAGILRLVQNLIGILNPFMHAIENIVPKRASEAFLQDGEEALDNYLLGFIISLSIPLSFVFLVLVVPSQFWIKFLYDLDFPQAFSLVFCFYGIYVVHFMRLLASIWFRTKELSREIFFAQLIGALAALALLYPMISILNIMGAVYGALLAQALIVAFLFTRIWQTKRKGYSNP